MNAGMEKFYLDQLFDLTSFSHKELFAGCKYPWEAFDSLEKYFTTGKIECEIPEGVTLINPESISIGAGTKLEPGAYIVGPCIIGKNCEIRRGAYLRGFVVMGDGCVIGSEIKSSILLDGVHAAHYNYVGDSILGNRVNLGAGVKLANLRLDKKPIAIEGIPTQRKKLGAIIGDDSQLGCNSVCNPGTVLKKKFLCRPNAVISVTNNRMVQDHVS